MTTKNAITMTDEQKALFNKLTPLQKDIVTNTLSGMKDIDAYKASKGKAKTENAMRASVCEILANPNVKAFLDSMKEAGISNAIMSRTEMMERLSSLARVNMNDLVEWADVYTEGEDGEPMQQSVWRIKDSAHQDPLAMASIAELAATKEGFKIKQHSPLAAMKQLSDLLGYNEASKIDHSSKDGSMSGQLKVTIVRPEKK